MASPHHSSAVSQDTLITIKISVNDSLKKLKLPLRDLGASVLPDKVCDKALTCCTGWTPCGLNNTYPYTYRSTRQLL